jgi:hypothetical protein
MRAALFPAIASVCVENPDRISEYQVNALNFVTAFYSLDEKAAREVDNERLIVAVAGWFRAFPCHTIAMEAVCRFMGAALVTPGLGEYVDREFRPLVVAAESRSNNRIQLSFAVRWVRQVRLIAHASNAAAEVMSHDDVRELCRGRVADVELILANEYGRSATPATLPLALCPALGFELTTIKVFEHGPSSVRSFSPEPVS